MNESSDSFVPDPALGGFFGIGILAAAVKDLPSGLFLGFGAAASAVALGAIEPLLRRHLSSRFLAPLSLAASTAIALAYGLALEAFFPAHAIGLWIYVPLLAVNYLSLHTIRRGVDEPLHSKPGASSRLVPLARGATSYLLVACLLGAFREAIGMGTISLPNPGSGGLTFLLSEVPPLRITSAPAGGFIILGFLSAIYRSWLRAHGKRIP